MDNIKKIFNRYKKVSYLFIIKVLSMGLKYILMFYLSSQLLNPDEFGKFSLYLVILNFTYLFVGFGVMDTGMYLLAKDSNKKLIGGILSITFFIAILMILLLILVLNYYGYESYIIISILSSGHIFSLFVRRVSVGLHDRFGMYYFDFFIYLTALLGIIFFSKNLESSLIIYAGATLILSIIFTIRFRPKFNNVIENINLIMTNIKGYGLGVHASQFIAMGTYDFDKIMLEYLFSFSSVGIYNLALNFIMPVKLFSTSIAEILFKDFSKNSKIKKEILIANFCISLFLSVILSVLGYLIVINFYSESYYEILNFIGLLPILAVLSSFYVPINNFFSAKGLAKQKLINAIAIAIANITFNFIFIPKFGIIGAIIATILALIINNIMFILQYIKYVKP